MTESEISSPNLPGKLALQQAQNRPCLSQIKSWRMVNLPSGSVRPIHRADVHIIEPQGSELWLDVKIHAVGPELNVAKELLREEQTKCNGIWSKKWLQLASTGEGHDTGILVLEQFGRTAPGAQARFNRIINHRLQLLVRQGMPFSHAKKGRQLRAVGPYLQHLASSCMAGPRRVYSKNRPGRLWRHSLKPAELPRGVSVNSMSA